MGRFDGLGAGGMELLFDNCQEAALFGVEKAVGAHLLESAVQDVLKEPADEALGWEGGDARGIGL